MTDQRKVYSVTQVNRLVAGMLAEYFADVWLEGEISNLRAYPSGHLYFALKDEESQLPAVCFRQSAAQLRFKLEDGLEVLGHGRLEVYAPSGKYQIILDTIEPRGLGALQKAFEQLKRRLDREGLFAAERKRPLPELPRVLGIVTSPAGAAIHDMLRTLRLHRAHLRVLLFPAQVQGEGAAEQIAEGIRYLSSRPEVDVIIAGRGGGSVEDLWSFNEEVVARAIAASRAPVVTGIGHEVDFTIADFVADVRAATPTAAAQLVAAGWERLDARFAETGRRLLDAVQEVLFGSEQRLDELVRHRAFELVTARLAEARYRLERGLAGAERRLRARALAARRSLAGLADRLARENPVQRVLHRKIALQSLAGRMEKPVQAAVRARGIRLASAAGRLDTLSPLASLGRGYAICRRPDGVVVSRVGQVEPGDDLSVRVSDGSLECAVRDVTGTAG